MPDRLQIEELEKELLAPYAVLSSNTRGRVIPEEESRYRTCFMRDRDRIIHSRAFRRLEYKTQVFVNHEGDHYRTRLTHTLEASQIARSVARAMGLNEPLVEAISLSHDLGHTPFGHAGEREMAGLMKDFGGFDHNMQTLRVVEKLEKRYPEFSGLNLTWEVREGIVKHSSHYKPETADPIYDPYLKPTLEAQVVMLADEIAYNNHDLDDGISSGMISKEDLSAVGLWADTFEEISRKFKGAPFDILKSKTISTIISRQVEDLIAASVQRLSDFNIDDPEKARNHPHLLIDFSDFMKKLHMELKDFLFKNLYSHYRVVRMEEKARRIIRDIFNAYRTRPEQLPASILETAEEGEPIERALCDHIAGMTDRYAMEEYDKLFDPKTRV